MVYFLKKWIRITKPKIMIGWIITAAVLSLIFAVLGFGGIASGFAGIAKILFYILLVVLVITLIASMV